MFKLLLISIVAALTLASNAPARSMASPVRPGAYENYVLDVPSQQDWGIRIIVTGAIPGEETPFWYNQRFASREACEDALQHDPTFAASFDAFKAANPTFRVESDPVCAPIPG